MILSKKHSSSIPTFLEIVLIILTYFLLTDTILPKLMKHFIEFQTQLQKLFYINSSCKVIALFILLIIIKNHLHNLLSDFKCPQVYKYGFFGFLGVYFIRIILGLVMMFIIGPDNFQSSLNQKLLTMVISEYPIFMFISIVILAPILEELVFRFAIFKPLSIRNKPMAYIVSSFIFGFLHISTSLIFMHNFNEIYNLPLYMSSGLVLAYVYDKTDRLAVPIIAHMLNNYIGFLFVILSQLI